MKRKHKTYSRPKRPFNKARIEEEAKLREEYGLKNKKEIWKADSQTKVIREKAKSLIPAGQEKQKALFEKLKKLGFKANSLADVLSLDKRDYLNRRLQTIVFKKRLAQSPKHARQLITHRKILVAGRAVDSPSYIVPVEFEGKIYAKQKNKRLKETPTPIIGEKENE